MYIPVDNVLTELNKDVFKSWELVKCEIETRDYNVIINPKYYEFNKEQFIKLGGFNYNRSCHLDKITEIQYNAEINISADLDIPYFYPIDIINKFIQEQFISVNIKLRYPHDLKSVFDTYNNYYDFYVNFYTKQNINNIYISCTEQDNLLQTDITVAPMQQWYTYVYNVVKG